MANIAESRIPIMLDKQRIMIFNANTMSAYEEATGNFFLDTVARLYEALKPSFDKAREDAKKEGVELSEVISLKPLEIARRIPMKELRALVWAAVHEYKEDDVPFWPLTINQIGRYISTSNVASIFLTFLKGQANNSPTEGEMGESPAPVVSGNIDAKKPHLVPENGGAPSIVLPADAFD